MTARTQKKGTPSDSARCYDSGRLHLDDAAAGAAKIPLFRGGARHPVDGADHPGTEWRGGGHRRHRPRAIGYDNGCTRHDFGNRQILVQGAAETGADDGVGRPSAGSRVHRGGRPLPAHSIGGKYGFMPADASGTSPIDGQGQPAHLPGVRQDAAELHWIGCHE